MTNSYDTKNTAAIFENARRLGVTVLALDVVSGTVLADKSDERSEEYVTWKVACDCESGRAHFYHGRYFPENKTAAVRDFTTRILENVPREETDES